MLDLRTPTLGDKERIDCFVHDSGQIGCDVSFTNTYLWRAHYDIKVAFDDDTYYKCYFQDGKLTGYAFPLTKGDIRRAVDNILNDARERGVTPVIGLLSDTNAELLKRMYGDRVTIEEDRSSFDYIYERESLAQLSGKKYHAKRNHLSRFLRNYDDYSIKEISQENFADVISVVERWLDGNDDTGELKVISEALDHLEELGMFGILLYVDGAPVAMSLGSRINDEVCDVNFEKAVDIDEAFAVINNEFAKRYTSFTLLNREEDMGLEGLRRSKLSYHPRLLLKKSTATFH